jgi:hypothetical protein
MMLSGFIIGCFSNFIFQFLYLLLNGGHLLLNKYGNNKVIVSNKNTISSFRFLFHMETIFNKYVFLFKNMNYLLIFLTGLVAFTWGMIFAFYLIFVRASLRITNLLSKILCKDISIEEVFETLRHIIDRAYQDMKSKENNETP